MSEKAKIDIKKPRGTRDFMPREMMLRKNVESLIRTTFGLFGFQEIQTPTFEQLSLFELRSGDKFREDIYRFVSPTKDDAEDQTVEFCLRPELTAPTCRFFVTDDLGAGSKPVKVYYIGPCFRYDKPALGRYREFTQAGIEIFGAESSRADAEVIEVAAATLKSLGIENYRIQISDMSILRTFLTNLDLDKTKQAKVIGIIDNCGSDLAKLKLGSIEGSEENFINEFRKDLKKYVEKPIVEILESLLYLKGGLEVIKKAESIFKDYQEVVEVVKKSSLTKVYSILQANKYGETVIDFSIARGLDYYTGLVFEIDVDELGAQKQVCGGGRYDNLVREYGGHETPATGFGLGFDRLVQCVELFKTKALPTESQLSRSDVLVKMMIEDIPTEVQLVNDLRASGIRVEVDLIDRSMKKLFAFASKAEISYVIILGKQELENKEITIKNLKTEKQETLAFDTKKVIEYIKKDL
jgi:histidyl-tRNA synthetase